MEEVFRRPSSSGDNFFYSKKGKEKDEEDSDGGTHIVKCSTKGYSGISKEVKNFNIKDKQGVWSIEIYRTKFQTNMKTN